MTDLRINRYKCRFKMAVANTVPVTNVSFCKLVKKGILAEKRG